MDFDFIRCSCGGIIGTYDREHFTCERCGQEFRYYLLNYDGLKINDKTGWVFPVIYRFGD